jgi:hypothetical protein
MVVTAFAGLALAVPAYARNERPEGRVAMSFTYGLQVPRATAGTKVSRFTCVMLLMVLMSEIAFAPPERQPRAAIQPI